MVNGGSGNADKHILISAREMARVGHLFLNGGRWKQRQLLSDKWIAEATRVQVPVTLPLGHPPSNIDGRGVYGLNWWVNGTYPGYFTLFVRSHYSATALPLVQHGVIEIPLRQGGKAVT
jgi:CubicO group peptidase (beta-lactamase class C family)